MIRVILSQLWVQQLGWTLLHFLWQGTMIAAIYAILRSTLRHSFSAQGRYALAYAALVSMAIAPPVTFLFVRTDYQTGSWTLSPSDLQRLLSMVVVFWTLGVLAFVIRLLGGWRFVVRLRSTSHPASIDWQQTLEWVATRVGVTQRTRLLVSSVVDVPTVLGWLRPTILIPVEFLTGLSFEHITALLAHEMAHIRRYDYVANFLQGIIESILFYHPAVWWVSQQIRAERELCCDDLAVAITGDAFIYAKALAELESRQSQRLTLTLAANGGVLLNRIRRLIEPTYTAANSAPGPATAWAMTLLWLAGVGAAAVHGGHAMGTDTLRLVPAPSSPVAALLYDPAIPARQMQSRGRDHNLRSPQEVQMHASVGSPADLQEDIRTNAAIDGKTSRVPADPWDLRQADSIDLPTDIARNLEFEIPILPVATAPLKERPVDLPPTPTFRTAAKLVQIDVVARTKGAPAIGLTKNDFTLLDNGTPQSIALFSVTSSQTPGPAAVPVPAGSVSNGLDCNGNSLANATVLLLDQRGTATADQAFAIQRVLKFFDARLRKNEKSDRLGIYIFGRNGLQVVQEVTDDVHLLREAVSNLKPLPTSQVAFNTTERPSLRTEDRPMLDTRHVLETIARHLAIIPGRKGLIWISGDRQVGMAEDFRFDIEEAARTLNDAGVALYSVDARGLLGALAGPSAVASAEWGATRPIAETASFGLPTIAPQRPKELNAGGGVMSFLADLTGGLALYNTNGIEDSVARALDDAELTYTLGFYPEKEEPNGAWHNLKVEVSKPGVRVRSRKKYFAPGMLASAKDRPTLPELLRAPIDATQLRLVAETTADGTQPDVRLVHLSVDLRDVHLENQNDSWAGGVDVSFFVEGARTAQTVSRSLKIPDEELAAALKKGIVVDKSIHAVGQTGELRVIAQDRATGAAGSVTIPLR